MPEITGEYQWPGRVPWNAHPAAWYQFSRDRKAEQPAEHLKTYKGWIHADGCSGFNELYRSGHVHEVACMAHIRRKFVNVHASQHFDLGDGRVFERHQGDVLFPARV